MSNTNTAIQWTDATWNVVVGCTKVSPGCRECYAKDLHDKRHAAYKAGKRVPLQYAEPFEKVQLMPERLREPLSWQKPRRVFVNSVSDLFHEDVPFGFVMRVLDVMARTPQHTYQILTKRPERMAEFFGRWGDLAGEDFEPKLVRGPDEARKAHPSGRGQLFADMLGSMGEPPAGCAYPTFDWMEGMIGWPTVFHNIHLGFSAESQECFDRRAVLMAPLMRAGWTVFVSAEPLLGPLVVQGWDGTVQRNWLHGPDGPGIRWLIAGGESGTDARTCRVEWLRSLRDQCRGAGVAFFCKQLGSNATSTLPDGETWPGHDGPTSRVQFSGDGFGNYRVSGLKDRKGGTPDEWPEDLRVREFPGFAE